MYFLSLGRFSIVGSHSNTGSSVGHDVHAGHPHYCPDPIPVFSHLFPVLLAMLAQSPIVENVDEMHPSSMHASFERYNP